MAQFLNQYSFLWVSALGLSIVIVVLALRRAPTNQWVAAGALAAGLVLAFVLLHPQATDPAEAQRARASIGGGKPVLLEFQSPY